MPVSEQEIDQILEQLEKGAVEPEAIFEEISSKQGPLAAYITGTSFDYMTEGEKGLFLFLLSLIWLVHPKAERISLDKIEETEDKHWEMFNESGPGAFSEKLDAFFEAYPKEEELLAAIEDSLFDAEEAGITPVGREWMWVGLATAVSLLREES
jgi:hypothetical protein